MICMCLFLPPCSHVETSLCWFWSHWKHCLQYVSGVSKHCDPILGRTTTLRGRCWTSEESLSGKVFKTWSSTWWLIPRILSRWNNTGYKWINPTHPTKKNRVITYLGSVEWATKHKNALKKNREFKGIFLQNFSSKNLDQTRRDGT